MQSERLAGQICAAPDHDRLAEAIASLLRRKDELTSGERIKLRALEANLKLVPRRH